MGADNGLSISAYSLPVSSGKARNTRCQTPSAMAQVNHAQIAEALTQIPPGNANSIAEEDGLDKQPAVFANRTDMAGSAGAQIAKAIPVVISQGVAAGHWLD